MWRGIGTLGVLLVGCAGDGTTDTDTDTSVEATLCEGAGDPVVQLGLGVAASFTPFTDGEDLAITTDPAGAYGFEMDVLTEGLDTTEAVSTVLRVSVGSDPTEDYIANLILQCPEEGPGWTRVFAPLDDTLQDELSAMALVGQTLDLSLTITDQAAEADTAEASLFVAWPATTR